MKFLNLACGSVRPQGDEWWNLDHLREFLHEGTPERRNLDAEPRYIDHQLGSGPLPFSDGEISAVAASHCIEHFDCMEGLAILRECHRVLAPDGALVVSVPDAEYFRQHYNEDTIENAPRIFGEAIYLPDGEVTFFDYALWMRQHKAILTETVLWAYFAKAGFKQISRLTLAGSTDGSIFATGPHCEHPAVGRIISILNRLPFSLVMVGVKE